tara:strand:- start:12770 stop:13234 length:465 start_codon:yes stop_codon:yes gene_type:complete
MITIILLFLAGVVLIGSEVFLPGGILGAIGGALMVGGIAVSYTEFGAFIAFIATIVAIASVFLALFFEFKILPRTPMGKQLFMSGTIKDSTIYVKAGDDVVGQIGRTVTALGPTGFVLLGSRKLEAASKSGFIEKNEEVRVTGKDNFRITVSKL